MNLSRVVVQDASVRLSPVRLDRAGESRVDAAIDGASYDRDAQMLRIDVPRGEGAVEFLIRVMPTLLSQLG